MTDRRSLVAAAIIAGGRGSRLGHVDKNALLIGGRSILQWQLGVLRPLFARILLVTATPPEPLPPAVTAVQDRPPPGRGPLAGIEAALHALAPYEEAIVCLGGDMPLLQAPALELLRDLEPAAPALIPIVANHPEPLFARYARSCLPPLTATLTAGQLKASAFAQSIKGAYRLSEDRLRTTDPGLLSLQNVNTPEDLSRVEAHLRQASRPV